MRTSINILISNVHKLNEACENSGRGYSELINLCLRKYFASHPERLKRSIIEKLVEYQPKGAGYHITAIVFAQDVYNLAVNFRSFCRLSVSKMLTYALEYFLDEVLREIEEKIVVHNYVAYRHNMRHNGIQHCPEWVIEWEVGRQKETT